MFYEITCGRKQKMKGEKLMSIKEMMKKAESGDVKAIFEVASYYLELKDVQIVKWQKNY